MRQRRRNFKVYIICLSLVLSLICGGCIKPEKPLKQPEQLAEKENLQVSFDDFLDELFISDLQDNIVNLHYTVANPGDYGIEEYSLSLGEFGREAFLESLEELEETLKELHGFSYEALSGEQQTTYDILEEYLQMQLDGRDFYLYEEPLSPTSGVQSQLPLLLAEYTFRCDRDVEDYLGLLENIGTYFQGLLEFEKEKAQAGLFMSDTTLENVIAQCRAFIENPKDNLLITSFTERMEDYVPENNIRQEWEARNRTTVLEQVIPAYRSLADTLEGMKGSGQNTGGLFNLEKGKEYYEYLLQYYTGSGKTVEEMRRMLEAAEEKAMNRMIELLTQDPSLIYSLGNVNLQAETPEEMLEELRQRIQEDFPEGGSDSYEVKYVDKSLEEYTSPAFYLTPAIDDTSGNVIYINESGKAEGIELYTTLAHEGYPGHLYQETYYKDTKPHPVRSLLYFGGYTEGWGIYAEHYGYQCADLQEEVKELLKCNFTVSLCLYSEMDLGIHFEGWDLKQTSEYLAENGIADEAAAKGVFDYIVSEPGNYLKYFVGYLEIMELKDEYQSRAGELYTEKDFHTFFLGEGPMSFSMLEKRLGIIFPEEK